MTSDPAAIVLMALLMVLALAWWPSAAAAGIDSTIRPVVGAATTCTYVGVNLTCSKPVSTVSGHLLLFFEYDNSSGTVSGPAGFTQVRQDAAGGVRTTTYYKVAGASEPASYTITFGSTPGAAGAGTLIDVANIGATPLDSNSGVANGSHANPFTISAPSTSSDLDLTIVCAGMNNPMTIGIAGANPLAINNPTNGSTTCWSYTGNGQNAVITSTSPGGYYSNGVQVAVAPMQISTGSVNTQYGVFRQPAQFGPLIAAGTPASSSAANPLTGYGVNGCFNPVAYGADPTGQLDSSAALNSTSAAACAAHGQICIPPGTFLLQSVPWLVMCPSGYAPDIFGAGPNSTILVNKLGSSQSLGGGPTLEIAQSQVMNGFGTASALVGTGNSWNNGTGGGLFWLNSVLGQQPINGLSQFDVQACFQTTTNGAIQYIAADEGAAAPIATGCNASHGPGGVTTCLGAFQLGLNASGKLFASIDTSTTGYTSPASLLSSSAVGTGTVCAELSYDGSNVRLYHGAPNTTMTEDAKVAQTGTIVERPDEDLTMLALSRFWHLLNPTGFWQGKMDTFRISKVARCTNDSGCTAPNAKLNGDSSTLFLENWTNVSNLPLVGPEYTNYIANTPGPLTQSWMYLQNYGLGNPGNNYPVVENFSVSGGMVGMHANAVAPQMRNLTMGLASGGTAYGFLLDQSDDYNSSGINLVAVGNIPAVITGGLTTLTNIQFTCGLTCGEFGGPGIFGGTLLPSSSVKWEMVVGSFVHIDSIADDAENGGTYTAILLANTSGTGNSTLQVTNSILSGYNEPIITLDGSVDNVTLDTDGFIHVAGTGPYVDSTNAQGSGYHVTLNNNKYDGADCPTGGNTFVSGGTPYEVHGGCTDSQNMLSGTTAGWATSSEPVQSSNRKKLRVYLNGYENTTATAQTVPVPNAFTTVITGVETVSGSCTGVSATMTTLTLPASMSAAQSGLCEFDGY